MNLNQPGILVILLNNDHVLIEQTNSIEISIANNFSPNTQNQWLVMHKPIKILEISFEPALHLPSYINRYSITHKENVIFIVCNWMQEIITQSLERNQTQLMLARQSSCYEQYIQKILENTVLLCKRCKKIGHIASQCNLLPQKKKRSRKNNCDDLNFTQTITVNNNTEVDNTDYKQIVINPIIHTEIVINPNKKIIIE